MHSGPVVLGGVSENAADLPAPSKFGLVRCVSACCSRNPFFSSKIQHNKSKSSRKSQPAFQLRCFASLWFKIRVRPAEIRLRAIRVCFLLSKFLLFPSGRPTKSHQVTPSQTIENSLPRKNQNDCPLTPDAKIGNPLLKNL